MAKKLYIGNKGFTNAIKHLPLKPNNALVKCLDSKMFPLDSNNVFNYKPEYLAAKEFESTLNLASRRFGSNFSFNSISPKIAGLFNFISKQETPFKKQLEVLAIDTIRELYNVPDHINLNAIINKNTELDLDQDHNPNPFLSLSLEKKNEMRDQINKRVVLNGLVHGSSMHIWKTAYYIVREKLSKINPVLIELYDEYTAGVNLLFWSFSPQQISSAIQNQQQITQGFNQVKFDHSGNKKVDIDCEGINFPVLLHELNKGVMDYLICHGIPQEYSEEELTYYYSKSDLYEDEFWHYILSPTLWVDLLETISLSPQEIPTVIMKLSKLNYSTLTEIFRSMMDDKQKAKTKLELWKVI